MPLQVGVLEPTGTTSPEVVVQPEGRHEHSKDSDDTHISPVGVADAEHVVPHGHQPGGISCDPIDRTPLQAAAMATGTESTGITYHCSENLNYK